MDTVHSRIGVRIFNPLFDDILPLFDRILWNLCLYIEGGGEVHKDAREYLYPEDMENVCRIIDTDDIPDIRNILETILGENLVSSKILFLSPGGHTVAFSSSDKIYRGYIPLILSYPYRSSGVWIKGSGVKHHREGRHILHSMQTPHNIFNYSKGEIALLVVDVKLTQNIINKRRGNMLSSSQKR